MKKKKPNRPAATKSSHYKITNWPEYNQALKQRGSLQVWFSDDIEKAWYFQGKHKKGAQYIYSDCCIEVAIIIKQVYSLGYRQTQGLLESIILQKGWDVIVPDYTVIQRRNKKLSVSINCHNQGATRYLVVDSTGAKVYGEGEWKVRQHGYSKHRTWRKIHLAVDEGSKEIKSCMMTTNSVDDAAMIAPLLDQVEEKVSRLAADGAYDKNKVYKELLDRKIKPVIPPRKNARITKHGNSKGKELARDKAIRDIRRVGRKQWKQEAGYHRRSLAESTMFRYKVTFGDKLNSRIIEHQQVEVRIKCYILNRMASFGMPIARKIKPPA